MIKEVLLLKVNFIQAFVLAETRRFLTLCLLSFAAHVVWIACFTLRESI